jgi:hypothetical protein
MVDRIDCLLLLRKLLFYLMVGVKCYGIGNLCLVICFSSIGAPVSD